MGVKLYFCCFMYGGYKVTVIVISFILFILVLVFIAQVIVSGKFLVKRERLTPLESGFESLLCRMSVRAPFFFLALLFVLFDMELILFFPGVVSVLRETGSILSWVLINFVILFTLIVE